MPLIPDGDLKALFKLINGNLDEKNFSNRADLSGVGVTGGGTTTTTTTPRNMVTTDSDQNIDAVKVFRSNIRIQAGQKIIFES